MIKKVEGIVIKETEYKESSKIINIFTREFGIIGVMAYGVKKIKSPLNAVTTKLTYGYFHINYKENNKLHSLIEVDVINSFKNIKKDLHKISYAIYLTELSYQVYKHEKNSNIYDLCINAILKINEGYDPKVLTIIVELKMLDFLGIRPIIDCCAICGSSTNIVTISSYKGGYLCSKCYQNDDVVNIKTIKLLCMFYYLDISKISKLDISDNIKKELTKFIDDYYDRYAGLYLKSKELIDNLSKIYE